MPEETSQRYPEIDQPLPAEEAFGSEGAAAAQSQAAALLALGWWLRAAPEASSEGLVEPRRQEPIAPPEDLEQIGIPARLEEISSYRGVRYGPATLHEQLGKDRVETWRDSRRPVERADQREVQSRLWNQLTIEPTGPTAASLIFTSCFHEDPLVRIAAAIASARALSRNTRTELDILEEGMTDPDPEVATLAQVGMSQLVARHPRLLELTAPSRRGGPPQPANMSLMVHGTFARGKLWWQPGGVFHDYVLNEVDDQLYAGGDRFDWSGGWSEAARALAAIDLMGWVNNRGHDGLDLFTHSHGGNVGMLATQGGLDLGRIVLLSCPVHARYLPDFARIAKAISVRTRMDLVILADGGGQRFRDPRIQENRLRIWFKHSITHDPATWRRHDIPAMI